MTSFITVVTRERASRLAQAKARVACGAYQLAPHVLRFWSDWTGWGGWTVNPPF